MFIFIDTKNLKSKKKIITEIFWIEYLSFVNLFGFLLHLGNSFIKKKINKIQFR